MKMNRMLLGQSQYHYVMRNKSPPTGLPMDPLGNDISMTLFGGSTYTEPTGSKLVGVKAPLIICSRTGSVGGVKVAPFMVKWKFVKLKLMSRLRVTSAVPRVGMPGAVGLLRGWRLVSIKGFETEEVVVGLMCAAPQ